MAESYRLYRRVTESVWFDADSDTEAQTIADLLAAGRVQVDGKWERSGDEPELVQLERVPWVAETEEFGEASIIREYDSTSA